MPLQKSFSDQNHSNKLNRAQWYRHKSLNTDRRNDRSPIAVDSLLQPISTASKNKLNSFQYDAKSRGDDSSSFAHKPDATSLQENKENPDAKRQKVDGDENVLSEAQTLTLKSSATSIDVPQTPASKFMSPGVLGMSDVRQFDENASPDGRILWAQDPVALQVLQQHAAAHQRRKRARSSSPTSSPARVSPTLGGSTKHSHSRRMTENLETPKSASTYELWDRNALGSAKISPDGLKLTPFAHLMFTSSPQPCRDGSARPARTFAKAATCGSEWPKRRKPSESEQLQLAGTSSGPSMYASTKLSKISALLEKVQEGMIGRAETMAQSDEVDSSPAGPGDGNTGIQEAESPIQQRNALSGNDAATTNRVMLGNDDEHAPDADFDIQQNAAHSSDYGEFDANDLYDCISKDVESETAKRLFPDVVDVASQNMTRTRLAAPVNDDPCAGPGAGPSTHKVQRSAEARSPETKPVYEFGESDEDAFTADLQVIASKYDREASKKAQTFELKDTERRPVRPTDEDMDSDRAKTTIRTESEDEFDDGFEDFDFAGAEAAATQSLKQSASDILPPTQKGRAIQRYFVVHVASTTYENSKGQLKPEKVVLVQIESSKVTRTVHLRDGWYETSINQDAYVHVIGTFSNNRCIVDDLQNMVILHPDHLISSTVVADSFSCARRAVLQDRIKATIQSSAPLVYGIILHEIFQESMIENRWDSAWLSGVVERTAQRHLEDLYTIQLQIPQAVEYLQSKMCELQAWAELFVTSKPKAGAVVKAGNGESASMCVSKLLDVEEHVWSPMYGLKGNIDATVQVTMMDGKKQRTLTVPFEVKTGKNANTAHRAQTALYNLLLSDRYDVEIAYGILYYLETSETIRIPAIRHEIRHMIMQRNELACYVRERSANLPPMLKKENLCNRCYAKVPCFIYHKLVDEGNGETSGMKDKFDEVVKHLTPRHKEFFTKWDDLLTKEEKESLKFRRELWTMLSSEREKLGRCYSNVIIKTGSAYEQKDSSKINRFCYQLIKENPPPGFSFLDSQITQGEPIVISDEKGHFALANGYVRNVRKDYISVEVDRRLHNSRIRQPGFDEIDNQTFASIMEVDPEVRNTTKPAGKIAEPPMQYRLDKDEFSNGMATVRNNLIHIMSRGPFGSHEIRSLVVDLVAPRFKLQSTAYSLADRKSINVDQRRAIEKVMSAQDYALVLGMPGTGKTTTIVHIIRALASQGKSVLLTSYTHTAVDNILLKLRDDDIPILRLGSISKISKEVQEFATLAATPKSSFEEIQKCWHGSPIVATTCLGINHALFNERTFDYCIVDEASQITLPVCLGPIRMARTFILVGDHNQLPPLVQNEDARIGGLDISLFKLLSDVHPSSVVNLEHQYRMCEEVMTLSNVLIYNGRLRCGSREVAKRSLHVPDMNALRNLHFTSSSISRSSKSVCPGPFRASCWIRDLLDPSMKARFVNTDKLHPKAREEAKGNRIVNPTEARLCAQLVQALLATGVPAASIGVMTHYRSQLALLKHALRGQPDVEMHTADRFQGRDKEVVVLSLVRSNEARSIGDLLKDWRRINVAFTRAKTKLLVVGSKETLQGSSSSSSSSGGSSSQSGAAAEEAMVARFVRLMDEKGWIYDLPAGAVESHIFDDVGSQVAPSGASRPMGTQCNQIVSKPSSLVAVDRSDRGGGEAKENLRPSPKKARVGERAIFSNRPVLKDIANDLLGV